MFDFKFSLAESNLILAALGKLPFNDVAGLIGNIRQQAEPQLPRVQAEIEAENAAAAAQKVADGAQEEGQEAA